jgi:hypothetical protein
MKLIADYLEHAIHFEHMAAVEKNPDLRAKFLKQAADFRRLGQADSDCPIHPNLPDERPRPEQTAIIWLHWILPDRHERICLRRSKF